MTTSIGKRSAESASFRIPATLEALGNPVTYSQKFHVNSEVASTEFHPLVAPSGEKCLLKKRELSAAPRNFLLRTNGDQGSQRFVAFRWPFPGISVSQELRPTEAVSAPTRAKRECSSLLRSSHVAPLAQFLDLN